MAQKISVGLSKYPAHSVCRLQRHTECAGYVLATLIDWPVLIGGVNGRVNDSGARESLAALGARTALAAMQFAPSVASPSQMEGDAQFVSQLGNLAFVQGDERAKESHGMPVAKLYGAIEGVGKLGPAVGINRVVAAMRAVSDGVELHAQRPGRGYRKQDHVAIRNDRQFHVFRGIMPLGNVDFPARETVAAEQGVDRPQIGNHVLDAAALRQLGRTLQLAGVPLAIVDGNRPNFVAQVQQVIQEGGRIHPAGKHDDHLFHTQRPDRRPSDF